MLAGEQQGNVGAYSSLGVFEVEFRMPGEVLKAGGRKAQNFDESGLRKGKVGDWINYLTEQHSREIELLVEKYLTPCIKMMTTEPCMNYRRHPTHQMRTGESLRM